jgi:hypothetical protein
MSRNGVKAQGASMWGKRNKLELLYGELSAISIKNRLYADPPELRQGDRDACALRHKRQAELLAEIARLDPTARPLMERD